MLVLRSIAISTGIKLLETRHSGACFNQESSRANLKTSVHPWIHLFPFSIFSFRHKKPFALLLEPSKSAAMGSTAFFNTVELLEATLVEVPIRQLFVL